MSNYCKITKEKTEEIINFGKMPIANGFLDKKNFDKEFFFNLSASFSRKVSLLQLNDFPKPSQMFNDNYPFYTSSSKFMINHFKEYSKFVKKLLPPKGKLIEIGSNDGTFLNNFKNLNIESVGIEPSKNVHIVACKRGIKSKNIFFNQFNIKKNVKNFIGKTDIIVGANVVCHIPNLIEFIKTCDLLLGPNGKIIFEEPYLGSMYDKTSYDQIYDEHIYIFSITSIKKIFELYDFDLINAHPQITHGGSMRYIISRSKTSKIKKRIFKLLDYENSKNISNIKGALDFKKNSEISKRNLNLKINKILSDGGKICGYGATSKSTTILNYCNINNSMINCIFDTTKDKIGKFTPGTHIPIVDYKFFKKSSYSHVFLFAWNHKKEILKKEKKKKIQWFSHLD